MFYHKVYMNQIHSSSLLCQLAAMWKNQVLCDAVIKTGNISTKAHRVVMVAACPMLHSMKNASSGSNLEIRLAADIKQEAITTFLQYLYEGFMMLTEDNCKDVEKIARVLQVESVLKCCADFYKCLHTGGEGYEYNFHNNTEFRHVRASDMLKVHDKMKRSSDSSRPTSPGIKRQRLHRASTSSDHGHQEFSGTAVANADPWDRVPKEGLVSHTSSSKGQQPGIVDMIEDSVEIVSADPPDDSGGTRRIHSSQDRVAISVSSQMNTASDVQIVNVSGSLYAMPKPGSVTQSDSHTSLSSTQFMNQSHSTSPYTRETSGSHSKVQRSDTLGQYHSPTTYTPPSQKTFSAPHPQARMPSPGPHLQAKPFAAGSMSQASLSHMAAHSTAVSTSPSTYPPVAGIGRRSDIVPQQTHPPDKTTANTANRTEAQTFNPEDVDSQSDLSIVKIEAPEIDTAEDNENLSGVDPNDSFCPDDPPSDWGHEDVSNEGSNVSGERQPWMSESFKDTELMSGNSGMQGFRSTQQRANSIDFSNYVMVELGDTLPPGYVRLDEDERVCVPSSWLSRTIQHCTGKPSFFTLKKLVDGFVNPWECKYGGTSAYKNTPLEPVFNALLLYGIKNLKMTSSMATRALNEKLASGRNVAKRLNISVAKS